MAVTVVTGSASGIGAAVRAQLESAGHRVIGIDRQNADVLADLSTAGGRKAAIEAAITACGGVLDGLVCCAGLGPTAPSSSVIVGVNYFGMSELVEGLEGALAHGQKPAVTLIGSVASVHPGMDKLPMVSAMLAGDEQQALAQADAMAMPQAAYAGSKYAIAVFARRKAVALGPKGIRINVVAPGAIETDFGGGVVRDNDQVNGFIASNTALGRVGLPDDIGAAVAVLLGDGGSWINGQRVEVSGGMFL